MIWADSGENARKKLEDRFSIQLSYGRKEMNAAYV
jgi:hypothetical protein